MSSVFSVEKGLTSNQWTILYRWLNDNLELIESKELDCVEIARVGRKGRLLCADTFVGWKDPLRGVSPSPGNIEEALHHVQSKRERERSKGGNE
jgi:hypothetical protein